jgi:hypothetical protein
MKRQLIARYFSQSVIYARLFSPTNVINCTVPPQNIPCTGDFLRGTADAELFLLDDIAARRILRYPPLPATSRVSMVPVLEHAIRQLLVIGFLHPDEGSPESARMIALARILGGAVESYADLLRDLAANPSYRPIERPLEAAIKQLSAGDWHSESVERFETAFDAQMVEAQRYVDAALSPETPAHGPLRQTMLQYCINVAAPLAASAPDQYGAVQLLEQRFSRRIEARHHDARISTAAASVAGIRSELIGLDSSEHGSVWKTFAAAAGLDTAADAYPATPSASALDRFITRDSGERSVQFILVWRLCAEMILQALEEQHAIEEADISAFARQAGALLKQVSDAEAVPAAAVPAAAPATSAATVLAAVPATSATTSSTVLPAAVRPPYSDIARLVQRFIELTYIKDYESMLFDAAVRFVQAVYTAGDVAFEFDSGAATRDLLSYIASGVAAATDKALPILSKQTKDSVTLMAAAFASAEAPPTLPSDQCFPLFPEQDQAAWGARVESKLGALYERWNEPESAAPVQQQDVVNALDTLILEQVFESFSRIYGKDMLQLLLYLQRRTPRPRAGATPDPLSADEAGAQQTEFFRPAPNEPLMLSAALNTFVAADTNTERKALSLQESVWRERIRELEAEAKDAAAKDAAESPGAGWTAAQALERIRGRWTPEQLAQAALRHAIDAQSTRRPVTVALVPPDVLFAVLWELFSSADFVLWLQRYNVTLHAPVLPSEPDAPSESTANETAFLNVRSTGVDPYVARSSAVQCGLVDEEFARALVGALIRQQTNIADWGSPSFNWKPFIDMAQRYGFSGVHLHEFWRQAIYGPIDDPSAVLCPDEDTPPGMSALDTRAVMAQLTALLDLDALLTEAIKKAPAEAAGISRIALLRAVVFYALTYLRQSAAKMMFTQQLAPDGSVLFDVFTPYVVPFVLSRIYQWPPWPVPERRGIQSEALAYSAPLSEFRVAEIATVIFGVRGKPRFWEVAAPALAIDTELDVNITDESAVEISKSLLSNEKHTWPNKPFIQIYGWLLASAATDRLLARHPLGILPYNGGDPAAGRAMVFAKLKGGTGSARWTDISPLSGINTRLGSRDGSYSQETSAFVPDARYSYYDWRRALRYFINPALARRTNVENAPHYDSLGKALDTAGLTGKLNADLGLPSVLVHQNSPLFYVINTALLDISIDADTIKQIFEEARTAVARPAAAGTVVPAIFSTVPEPPGLLRRLLPRRIEESPDREATRLRALRKGADAGYQALVIIRDKLWTRALAALALDKHPRFYTFKPKTLESLEAGLERLDSAIAALRSTVSLTDLRYTDADAAALESAKTRATAALQAYEYYVHMLEGAGPKLVKDLLEAGEPARAGQRIEPLDI